MTDSVSLALALGALGIAGAGGLTEEEIAALKSAVESSGIGWTEESGSETVKHIISSDYINVINNATSTSTADPVSAYIAKILQDQINNLKNIGRFLAVLDCSAGTVNSQPEGSVGDTYNYKVGDYFRVGADGTYAPKTTAVFTIDSTSGSTNFQTGSTSFKVGDLIFCSNLTSTTSVWVKMNGSAEGTVQDVQLNGTSIVASGTGVANIPILTSSALGVGKVSTSYGTAATNGGIIYLAKASDSEIAAKTNIYKPIVAASIDSAIKAGLGSYAGTAFTDAEKETALTTLGLTTTFILD